MPVLIPANRADPTGTKTLRENYRRHLQRPLNTLITDIRTGVIEEDVFGLRVSADTLANDALPPSAKLDRDQRKVDLFQQWLDSRLEEGVLQQIQRGQNTFIRSAYARGLKDAGRMIAAKGGSSAQRSIEVMFEQGIHRQALERLFAKNYAALEDITQSTSVQVSEELAQGLAAGENPRKVARRITDRIDKVGKTRAETLARTEIVDAHATATLNRYEQDGVDGVTPQAEFRTSRDDRVCPICKAIDGKEYTVEAARSATFQFEPDEDEDAQAGTFPVRPPVHPRCRCVLLPVIN